jgi:DNA-binding response OmpR family regulator
MPTILIVEDDERMSSTLVKGLSNSGYNTKVISDGLSARLTDITEYDLVILDWMLPKFSGIDILDYWRKVKLFKTPVIMFTAKADTDSIVTGLDYGADDYMSKFFTWEELNARIRVLLRKNINDVLVNFPVKYDSSNHTFTEDGIIINLTTTEAKLLRYFFEHPTKLITRSQINNAIYDNNFDPNSNTIERHIKSIRSKLNYDPILTIRSSGYRLKLVTQPKKS